MKLYANKKGLKTLAAKVFGRCSGRYDQNDLVR